MSQLLVRQLDNFRAAYVTLEERVHRALRTQVGDAQRLSDIRAQALTFMQSAEEVSLLLSWIAVLC